MYSSYGNLTLMGSLTLNIFMVVIWHNYVIVALVCTVSIAIGFPILLLLQPFLNHKDLYKNQTITGLVLRLLQRQVLLLCSLLHDLSTSDYHNCYC